MKSLAAVHRQLYRNACFHVPPRKRATLATARVENPTKTEMNTPVGPKPGGRASSHAGDLPEPGAAEIDEGRRSGRA
jgi:hypothetical protein